jgi:ATP-dependent DNA helicase RecG
MLRAVESGWQSAIMVPTEILAEQHFRNMRRMTENLEVRVVLLKSALRKAERSRAQEEIKTGQADIVVGTHALISEAVDFKALGFVVIDEQHRFGVLQRARLVRKATAPDILVMTATPIPRSLAITVYGDLELSVIDELPPSRKRTRTFIIGDTRKNRTWLYSEIRKELGDGRQAYFVYPFIEESENEDFKRVRHVTSMAEELSGEFPGFRVSLLHGRMKSDERDAVMDDFLAKRCDILVSTTVIEVGVDVPDATVIVIENAERFGLSQLHQMRGRVGRGEHESTCYIVYSSAVGEESGERLRIMGETSDGFRISEFDLAHRGPGEFMGTKQSGVPGFSFANLIRDSALLNESRDSARELIDEQENLGKYGKLFKHVRMKWGDMLELDTSS